MIPTEIYNLIMQDDIAKQLALIGNDEECAKRCIKISPLKQIPLSAKEIQLILSLRKKWGFIRSVSIDPNANIETKQLCIIVVDWVDKNYSIDLSLNEVQEILLELIKKQILNNDDLMALTEKSKVHEIITTEDISNAMLPYRNGGKI